MMYLDVRNKNKVTIVKEVNVDTFLVKVISSNKKYLVDKKYIKEIKV